MIRDAHGNVLLDLLAVGEEALDRLRPLTHAVVIARHAGTTLLVFNRYKAHWELPGGAIDAGELARACAVRELREESGLTCAERDLRFVGALELLVEEGGGGQAQLQYGALYRVEIAQVPPFAPTDEIAAVAWWDGTDRLANLSAIDEALVSRTPADR